MPAINVGDFRKGMKVLLDGQPCELLSVEFKKPGKGQAVYTTRIRNLMNGKIYDNKYRSGDSLESADVRNADGNYSYFDGKEYVFMDNESYEQVALAREIVGDDAAFLLDQITVDVLFYNDRPVGITLPSHIVMTITECEPGVKGDTATNATKSATVETGHKIQVPLFIREGDRVKIDTRSGSYVERINT